MSIKYRADGLPPDTSSLSPGEIDAGRTAADARPAYKIGAVAKITGISAHALRKWESRYAIVAPVRTAGGDRLYTREDVRRLMLSRSLIHAGMAIAEVADLPTEALAERCSELFGQPRSVAAPTPGSGTWRKIRVAVVGPSIGGALSAAGESALNGAGAGAPDAGGHRCFSLEAVVAEADPGELLERPECPPVDVLIWECPMLREGDLPTVDALVSRTRARAAIVVFGFGSRAAVGAIRSRHTSLLAAPVDPEELQRVAVGLLAELEDGEERAPGGSMLPVPAAQPPRYSMDTLIRVAHCSPKLACECPTHSSDLIMRLLAFEQYTAQCENANEEDAALHAYLHVSAGRARMLFEDALERLAEADGIPLD